MMLGGRQSGETFRSALPEPILNVDMLIVTFKFLPLLTTHENTLLLYYRHFSENAHDFLKSLQFVHDGSPSCIISTADFYMICEQIMICRSDFRCNCGCFFKANVV